jgi:hypothetical protein
MTSFDKLVEDMKCGVGVKPECEGTSVTLDVAGIKLATSEMVSVANFALQISSQGMAGEMTFNQIRAINAGRCALLFSGENLWTFLAGTYYVIKQFAT